VADGDRPEVPQRPERSPRLTPLGRVVAATFAILLAAALLAALLVWIISPDRSPLTRETCRAAIEAGEVSLSPEQARNAATISAVAVERELPARAVSIALATAYQESDLHNLDYGDRDSLGLFQQRPSQDWGTEDQIMDPAYAAGAFYDALTDIEGYQEMEITEAAQEVQNSAYPEAYADHADDARVLASALTGNSPASFSCQFRGADDDTPQEPGPEGLTPRAQTVRDELVAAFGELETGGYAPEGVDDGHVEGSAHYDGRAVDIAFQPYDDPAQRRLGWATAHWLVANADRLGIATVIYADHIWTLRRSDEGWREYRHPSGDADPPDGDPVLRHLDHVHVDVVGDS